MPIAPRAACRVWPCPRPASFRGLCREHGRAAERERGSARKRGYDSDWERARSAAPKGASVLCGLREAGHRRRSRGAGTGRTTQEARPDELRSKCHSCHSRRTAIDQSNWGRPRKCLARR